MPDAGYYRQEGTPAGNVPGRTTELARARTTGCITQAEYRQYRDWYLGLILLNSQTDNLIARRLWAEVRLPLGIEPQKEEA